MNVPSRNEPCPCGSTKKFKHCHINDLESLHTGRKGRDPIPFIIGMLGVIAGVVVMYTVDLKSGLAAAGAGVMTAVAYGLFKSPPSSKGGGDPGAINFGG